MVVSECLHGKFKLVWLQKMYFLSFVTPLITARWCGSWKCPYPPLGRSLEIPRRRGVSIAKIYRGKYEAKLEIPGGREGSNEKPSMGEVWIFSGTTHCVSLVSLLRFYNFFVTSQLFTQLPKQFVSTFKAAAEEKFKGALSTPKIKSWEPKPQF